MYRKNVFIGDRVITIESEENLSPIEFATQAVELIRNNESVENIPHIPSVAVTDHDLETENTIYLYFPIVLSNAGLYDLAVLIEEEIHRETNA